MNAIVKNIPNSITCLNITAGSIAIIFALQGNSEIYGMAAYNWAYIFIGIATVMDFLDGFAARLLHAYSELGKELDSLCDAVSFGVAPAMVLFSTLERLGSLRMAAMGSIADTRIRRSAPGKIQHRHPTDNEPLSVCRYRQTPFSG